MSLRNAINKTPIEGCYWKAQGWSIMTPEPYVAKRGNLLTIVASSYNVLVCLRVAKIFEDADISIEVINLLSSLVESIMDCKLEERV